jgi:purine nucleoside phosphorylase
VADLRSLVVFGSDAMGSTLVNEATVASYCGLNVLAMAVIAYKVELEFDHEIQHPTYEKIVDTARESSQNAIRLMTELVANLNVDLNNNIIS